MFDFSEILIIFVLALVVLGPKKLPGVAAQAGRWLGRARAMARQFREQLEQEVANAESALDTNAPRQAAPKPAEPPTNPGHASAEPHGPAEPHAPADPHAAAGSSADATHSAAPFATGLPWVDDPMPPHAPSAPEPQPAAAAPAHEDTKPNDGSAHERAT
jgi:sec-independent protein translocase protein TatB